MLYGAQIWGIQPRGQALPQSQLKALKGVQRKCLVRIAGAYKRTPTIALEKELAIPPLDLYLDTLTQQSAIKTQQDPIESSISRIQDKIWQQSQNNNLLRGRPSRRRPLQPRPPTALDLLRERAQARIHQIQQDLQPQEQLPSLLQPQITQRTPYPHKILEKGLDLDWKQRWERAAQIRQDSQPQRYLSTTWHTPWTVPAIALYTGLKKAEATALFLLCVTEHNETVSRDDQY